MDSNYFESKHRTKLADIKRKRQQDKKRKRKHG